MPGNMSYQVLNKISDNIRESLFEVLRNKQAKLLFNQDTTNIIKYFCAISEFGEGITEYELETIEIFFGRQGYPYSIIETIYQMNYLVNNRDAVLTDREHFENAVQLLNDDIVDVTTTEYQAPHKIIWAMILLKALYGMENVPAFGDALEYIGESFEEFGWTQPPLFFINNDKMENIFTHYDKEVVEAIKNYPNIEEIVLKKREVPDNVSNFIENYVKLNVSIIEYANERFGEFKKQILRISSPS